MKFFSALAGCVLLLSTSLTKLSSEPFKYKYEITANSNKAVDIYKLYDYKENLIDIYNEHFLALSESKREEKLINCIDLFKLDSNCRPYYISGTIVILIGEAKGVTLDGKLQQNSCDETVIRTKIFLFDLFR